MAGMANCGKHFPGHGWAEADSHVAVPHDSRSRVDLLKRDAAPYRWLGPQLTGVMPAHVIYDTVDASPAGFSAKWIRTLRKELGFAGAVFSDDLLMEGARTQGSMVERAQAAIGAGCDLVLVCSDTEAIDAVLHGLRWQPSRLFEERMERLSPRGAAMSMTDLKRSELYRLALADCEPLLIEGQPT